MSPPGVDLLDPGIFARGDQHELFRRLRREAPVFWNPTRGGGFWALLRYGDVGVVARDVVTFASSRGTGFQSSAPAAELLLNESDPPVHGQMRRLVAGVFTPRRIAALEPRVRARTRRLLGRLATRGYGDFMGDFAVPLAFGALAELIGIARADWPVVYESTHGLGCVEDPAIRRPGETPPAAFARFERDLYAHLGGFLDRAAGGESFGARVAALEGSTVAGRPVTRADVAALLRLLLEAGHESTANALAGGMLELAQRPEELARLRDDPGLVPLAVEEILRFTSPITRFGRRVAQDVELGGQAIRAGDRVVMFFPSANRDEEVFADGDRFDVGRAPNEHVAFGAGPHFCLGAGLARLQLQMFLEELLPLEPRIAGPVIRLGSTLNAGFRHVPVALRTR